MKTPNPEGYHVDLTTHNSRTSSRMIKHGIFAGPALLLNLEQEILLTRCIGQVIIESGFRCIAYNVCRDHVHLIIVCQPEHLTGIIQKIKSVSSKNFRRNLPRGQDPLDGHHPLSHSHLWSQKFYRANLDVWNLNTLTSQSGYIYKSTHLENAICYIINNRKKHKLPESLELEEVISTFVVSQELAFEK